MRQEANYFGIFFAAIFPILANVITSRVRMRATKAAGTVELKWPKWAAAFHWLAAGFWTGFFLLILVLGALVLEKGHWLAFMWALVFGVLFLGLAVWSIRLGRSKVVLDGSGVLERSGRKVTRVAWSDASVSSWAKITGVLITDGRGSEIVISHDSIGLELIDEIIRAHVPEGKIAFSKGEDGKRHIFLTSSFSGSAP